MISSKIEPLWYSNNINQRLSAVSELLMLFRMIFDKDGKISEVFWFSFPMWKRVWSSQCNNVKRTWTYWTILWACFSQNKINHIYVPCLPVYSKIYLASKSTNDKSVVKNHVTLTVPRCKDSRYCGGQVCAFGPTAYIWVCPASFLLEIPSNFQ